MLIAVAVLEDFEALDPAVDVLDGDAVSRKAAVKCFLFRGQFAFARFFEGRDAERMELANALKTFVTKQKDVCEQVNPTLFEQFEVVNRALRLVDANDPFALTVYHDLVFDSVTFLLAGVAFPLFFLGRSVSCSVASTTARQPACRLSLAPASTAEKTFHLR